MSWKDKFKGQGSVKTLPVGGKPTKFRTITAATAFRIRKLAKPLAKVITAYTEKSDRDCGIQNRDSRTPRGEGVETFHETYMEPIAIDVLKFRSERKDKALAEAVDLIMADENVHLLVEVAINSMREEFGDEVPSPEEFLEHFAADDLWDIAKGVFSANAGVFGPFGKAVQQASARYIAKLQAETEKDLQEASTEESPESTDETPG